MTEGPFTTNPKLPSRSGHTSRAVIFTLCSATVYSLVLIVVANFQGQLTGLGSVPPTATLLILDSYKITAVFLVASVILLGAFIYFDSNSDEHKAAKLYCAIILNTGISLAILLLVLFALYLPINNLAAQTDEGLPDQLLERLEEIRLEIERDMAKCPALFVRVSPKRPLQASIKNAIGWVLISLTVTTTGEVKDEKIMKSSLGPDFEEAALEAIVNFKFRPRVVDNKPRPFQNWVERIDFLPEDEVPSQSWPDPKEFFNIDCDE
jgi:TonB family protein